MDRADGGIEGVRSVSRAVELLQLFDAAHPHRTLRQLVELTGLPKTTVVRMIATLTQLGLLNDRGDSTYGLGVGLLRWVRLAQLVWEVDPDVRAVMRELSDWCGETVNIYVRQGERRFCIAQEEGLSTVRSVIPVGVALPLTLGAPGLVLLTEVSDRLLSSIVGEHDLNTVRARLDDVTERGWAVTHGEREIGASAVATALRGRQQQVIAALTISGPTSRFTDDRVESYARAVTEAAERITAIGMEEVELNLRTASP